MLCPELCPDICDKKIHFMFSDKVNFAFDDSLNQNMELVDGPEQDRRNGYGRSRSRSGKIEYFYFPSLVQFDVLTF